jgi:ABC-type polysaccharide/polyol phosphate export permease
METFSIFIDFMRKLYERRYTIKMMAVREFKARYVGSFFGLLWAVIDPLAQLTIYGIVFGILYKSRPSGNYGTDSFFLYLLCGLIPWRFFAQTITASTGVITANKNLIRKVSGFPSEILPIITVVSHIISHLIGVAILIVILLIFTGGIPPLAPLIFVYLFFISLFGVGLGWIVSSVHVYMKDVRQIIGVVLMGWFFFTPVFYTLERIPAPVRPFMKLNPMFDVIDGYRYILLAGKFPPLENLLSLIVISFLVLTIGGIFFRRLKPGFAEVL